MGDWGLRYGEFCAVKYFICPSKIGTSDTPKDKFLLFLGAIILLCNCPVELPLYQRNNRWLSHIGTDIKEH